MQVHGDAFIGKQFDDDNGFKRFNSTTEDLNTSLPWFKLTKQLNLQQPVTFLVFFFIEYRLLWRLQKMDMQPMKDTMAEQERVAAISVARKLKSEGNSFFKVGKLVDACEKYESCLKTPKKLDISIVHQQANSSKEETGPKWKRGTPFVKSTQPELYEMIPSVFSTVLTPSSPIKFISYVSSVSVEIYFSQRLFTFNTLPRPKDSVSLKTIRING